MENARPSRRGLLAAGAAAGLLAPTNPILAQPAKYALTYGPQLFITPRSGNQRHVIDCFVSITCNICYEFFGKVAEPLLKDEGLQDVTWVFTLTPRTEKELATAAHFMRIEQGRRIEAFVDIMRDGYKTLQRRGHHELDYGIARKIAGFYPTQADAPANAIDQGLRLANKYFYDTLDADDMPLIFHNKKRVKFDRKVTNREPLRRAMRAALVA